MSISVYPAPSSGAAGGPIGSLTATKTLTGIAWGIGNTTLFTANGLVRIEGFAFLVTTNFGSGGAATVALNFNGTNVFTASGFANFTAGKVMQKTSAAGQAMIGAAGGLGFDLLANPVTNQFIQGYLPSGGLIEAVVAAAALNAGAVFLWCCYTPVSAGATIT